ncbi:MAG: hypothetical protein ACD_58C00023G0001 [uncultured bacterium]|nr:MAG: hypothetical protein ACD_58C00023G0001 [uncultured bacterium]
MMTHRTNVLLDDQSKMILDYLIAKKKKTAGGIFRDFLIKEGKKHKVMVKSTRTRMEVLAEFDRLRKYINTKGIDYKAMINDGRKY